MKPLLVELSWLRFRATELWNWFADWRRAATLLRSPVARVVAIIPAIGYAALYSDSLNQFFENRISIPVAPLLAVTDRIHLLYVGATVLLAGMLLYIAFCPRIVKRFANHEDYVAECHNLRNPHTLQVAVLDLIASANQSAVDATLDRMRSVIEVNGDADILTSVVRGGQVVREPTISMMHVLRGPNPPVQDSLPDQVAHDVGDYASDKGARIFRNEELRSLVTDILEDHYKELATKSYRLARLSAILSWGGLFVLLIPALETAWRVSLTLHRHTFVWAALAAIAALAVLAVVTGRNRRDLDR